MAWFVVATAFPETTAIVEDVLARGGGQRLPKGSVELSQLAPGTHIKPHCGPSDHKWRLHLGLLVPADGLAAIRVGEHVEPWVAGKALLFDDVRCSLSTTALFVC